MDAHAHLDLFGESLDLALAHIRGTTGDDIAATVEKNFAAFVSADQHLPAACGGFFEGR